MKKSELTFAAAQAPLDFLMLAIAAIVAYYIRFESSYTELRPVIYELPFKTYLNIVFPIIFCWLLIFAFAGLYKIKNTRRVLDEFSKVVLACSTGVMAVIIYIFLKREMFSSRFVVLASWILGIIFVFLARVAMIYTQRWLLKKGIGINKAVLVGNSKTSDIIKEEFDKNPSFGYKVIEKFVNFRENELANLAEKEEIDVIIQTDQNMGKEEIMNLLDFAAVNQISFKYTADLFGAAAIQREVSTIADIPIIEIKRTSLDGWGRIVKRTFDIIGAIIAIIIFSPAMIAAMIAIKFDSKGPVFYLDYRYGQKFKKFICYKFRSMYIEMCSGDGPTGTESGNKIFEKLFVSELNTRQGPLIKVKDDPRVTRVGKFIRKFSIDEFPQFFNVLKGDLSIVGPRPHMSIEVAKYEKHHKRLFEIKPGITGLAQISGRSDLDFEDEVKLDTYYIENWSLKMDLAILLKTPFALLRNRKVE
ncbi:MAG: sugar transferase [bacterium]